MTAFTQTIHASANGIALIEAADYAAMRELLKLDILGTFTEHQSNPLLSPEGTEDDITFASVVFDAALDKYVMFYQYNDASNVEQIGRATSDDGITWAKDAANNPVLATSGGWDADGVGVPRVWIEDGTYYMLYRGRPDSAIEDAVGLARSEDGIAWTPEATNPVLEGTAEAWDASGAETWGIIKVGTTYYTYYEASIGGDGLARGIGVATSTDLVTWTKNANNPIMTGGRFCPDVIKYGDYYYLFQPHYAYSNKAVRIEVYRDTEPTFLPASRVYLGIAAKSAGSGWTSRSIDTPCILTDTINRDTFDCTSGDLWMYIAGIDEANRFWKEGLMISAHVNGAWSENDEARGSALGRYQRMWVGQFLNVGTTESDKPLHIRSADSGVDELTFDNDGPAGVPNLTISRDQTSYSTGAPLGRLSFGGRDTGSGGEIGMAAAIEAVAEGVQGLLSTPVGLRFYVTPAGSRTQVLALSILSSSLLQLGGDLDANGNTIHFGTAENEATIATETNPNTCTVNLGAENHWTIPANDANNPINATITPPPGPCGGTIFIEQGATPRDITWLPAESVVWLGTEPTWTDASEASEFHALSWRYNGTYLFLSDSGKTSITP